MRFSLKASLFLSCSLACGAQTIPPKQITPSQVSGQVMTTVTAGQPPSWQTPAAPGTGVSVAATSPILVNGGAGPVTSGTATISCPGCGASQIQQLINIPPIGGLQAALVYFTATTNSGIGTGGNFAYSYADPTGQTPSSGYVAHGGCGPWNPGGACVSEVEATYLNPVLPSYISPSSVSQVWPVAVVSSGGPSGHGFVASTSLSCTNPSGGAVPDLLGAVAQVAIPPQQIEKQDVGVTGAQIASITCTLNVTSDDSVQTANNAYASAIALIVYYAGSAPPLSNSLNVAYPLSYQAVNNVFGLTTPYNYAADLGSVNAISLNQFFFDTGGNPRQAQPGDEIDFIPAFSNTTTAPTLTYFGNTVGAQTIVKPSSSGAVALAVGDLVGDAQCCIAKVIYDPNNQWELQNPQTSGGGGSGISGLTTGQVGIAGSATTLTSSIAFGTAGSDLLQLASGKVPVATLPLFTSGANGAVVASGGGTTNFLRADGTWAAPPGGGGSGTIVASAQFELPYYSTSGVAQTLTGDAGITTDGSGNESVKSLTLTGPVNGFFNMTTAGTLPAAPSTNTVQITVPNTVTTPYAIELPPVPPSGSLNSLSCTSANPTVCTWAAGGSVTAGTGIGVSGSTVTNLGNTDTNVVTSLAWPTGGTDSSSAASTFLNSGSNITGYIPCGTYTWSSPVTVAATSTTAKNIKLYAASPGCVTINLASGDGLWFDNTTSSADNFFGPTIDGIIFNDNSGTGAVHSCIRLTEYAYFYLNNVRCNNAVGKQYQTGTLTATQGSTSVTGSGTTWTSAMAGGFLWVGDNYQEVASVGSSTALTLVDPWQPATASSSAYSLDYNGVGILFDGGTSYTQFGTVSNYYGLTDRVGVQALGSSAGGVGVSRIRFYGGEINSSRTPDSVGFHLGDTSDTFDINTSINNVAIGWNLENSHANKISGADLENQGAFTVVSTCNGGVASQTCIKGFSSVGQSSSNARNNTVENTYIYNTGTAVSWDQYSYYFSAIGNRILPSVNTTVFAPPSSSTSGYTTASVVDDTLTLHPSLIVSGIATSPSTSPVCPNGTGGALTTSGCSGGGGTPGGSNTQLQYNNSSAFGGMATSDFNNSTGVLTFANTVAYGSSYDLGALVENINSVNIPTFWGTSFGASIIGATTVPTSANVNEIAGVVGFVDVLTGPLFTSNNAGIGVKSKCQNDVAGGYCFGAVLEASSTTGNAAAKLEALELHENIANAGDGVGGNGGTLDIEGVWAVQPTTAFPSIYVGLPGGAATTPHYNSGIQTAAGAATNIFEAGPAAASGSSLASQTAVFDNVDSGSTLRQSTIKTNAAGNFVLTPFGAVTDVIGGLNISGLAGGGTQCATVDNSGNVGGSGSNCSAPLTTKGDLFGFSTANARIPVGADGFVLTADSTQTLGVKWAAAGGGSGCMTPITVTLGSAGNFNFTGIPQTCHTLVIDLMGANNGGAGGLTLTFNADTGSDYNYWGSYNGSASGTVAVNSDSSMAVGLTSANIANWGVNATTSFTAVIPGYTVTNRGKSITYQNARSNNFNSIIYLAGGGNWTPATSAAITSIQLISSGTFEAGTTATISGR